MFGRSPIGLAAPRPAVSIGGWNLSTDKGFYYVLLIITVLVVIAMMVISCGRLGRLLEAMADSPLALETHGATSSVLKVIVFCITAAMASMAGAFDREAVSLRGRQLLPVVQLAEPGRHRGDHHRGRPVVRGHRRDRLLGHPGLHHGGSTTTSCLTCCSGSAPPRRPGADQAAMPQSVRRFLDRLGGRPAPAAAGRPPVAPKPTAAARVEAAGGRGGDRRGPDRRRRGRRVQARAWRCATFRAVRRRQGGQRGEPPGPDGRHHRADRPQRGGQDHHVQRLSGVEQADSGCGILHGTTSPGRSPPRRARRGLGRTFQRTELYNSLTVRQNIAMGREASMAGANPVAQVFSSPRRTG